MQELLTNATDPVICMRRFRMLQQISVYEGMAIKKIQNLETDDVLDFLKPSFIKEADAVVNRNA